jgi:hypothetical protein
VGQIGAGLTVVLLEELRGFSPRDSELEEEEVEELWQKREEAEQGSCEEPEEEGDGLQEGTA